MDAWGSGRREHVDNHALHSELEAFLSQHGVVTPKRAESVRRKAEQAARPLKPFRVNLAWPLGDPTPTHGTPSHHLLTK